MGCLRQYPIVLKAILSPAAKLIKSHEIDSWPKFQLPPGIETLEDFEIYAAKRSCIKHELDGLLWLYERSSTSAIRHLVIYALAGLPSNYIAEADPLAPPLWDEIRDEKDRMLMDCMEMTHKGTTRWIPKDIPDIESRIEPLLRLEILFRPLRRRFPSGLFGKHDLDFSRMAMSDTLSITLCSLNDPHIQKPKHLGSDSKIAAKALGDSVLHHPDVWNSLIHQWSSDSTQTTMSSHMTDIFINIDELTPETDPDMCLNLITAIYFPEQHSHTSSSCTLADIMLGDPPTKRTIICSLSLFFGNPIWNLFDDLEVAKVKLLCTIIHNQSEFPLFMPFALQALNRTICTKDSVLYLLRFEVIVSYIANSVSPSFGWDDPDSIAHAFVCMASLIHQAPHYHIDLPRADWDKRVLVREYPSGHRRSSVIPFIIFVCH